MSIASRTSLAGAFAAGLAVTSAQAAVQGFSISLTDMTFQIGSNLSAEVAAFGDQKAQALQHNGHYEETLTGDYAVSDTLPPSDQSVFWRTFTQITLNGQPFFTVDDIVGPYSGDEIWQAVLDITKLTSAQLMVLRAVLEHFDAFSVGGGEFDYRYNYNHSPTPNQMVGTFAVGSIGVVDSIADSEDPFAAFGSDPDTDPGVWSLTFRATVTTIPEPPTWLMLMAGGAGLLLMQGLARRPGVARRVLA